MSEPDDSRSVLQLLSRRSFFAFAAVILGVIWAGLRELYRYASAPALLSQQPCSRAPVELSSKSGSLQWEQLGGGIDDWSGLSCTPIYGLVRVTREKDVLCALALARARNLPITAAGQRHSMGGQAFSRGGVILDMRPLNQVWVDSTQGVVKAQAGATWADMLRALDPLGLAIRSMQSYDVFTLGGSLSVNGHGISRDFGAIAQTVRELRVLLANGTIVTASSTENADLFCHVLGGYGLFGIVLDATLSLTRNSLYRVELSRLRTKEFPEYCRRHLGDSTAIPLVYGRFSVAPGNGYMDDLVMHEFHTTREDGKTSLPPMNASVNDALIRFLLNISKTGPVGRWLRWRAERIAGCRVDHGRALPGMSGDCFVTRNTACDDSPVYLTDRLDDANLLQEYFVPADYVPAFMDGLREIVRLNKMNLINVTLRLVPSDSITALSYAPHEMIALVLYCSEPRQAAPRAQLREATRRLIDLSIAGGGTFYLPYRLDYDILQLRAAYPTIDDFFSAKRRYDPEERFTNHFYETFGRRP